MSFEIEGVLVEKMDTVQVSDKFSKREFVIEVTPDNPNLTFTDLVKFQLTQDRCDLIESVSVGSELKVLFNVRGRKWEKDGKVSYFTNLEAWKLDNIEAVEIKHDSEDITPADEALKEEDDSLLFNTN